MNSTYFATRPRICRGEFTLLNSHRLPLETCGSIAPRDTWSAMRHTNSGTMPVFTARLPMVGKSGSGIFHPLEFMLNAFVDRNYPDKQPRPDAASAA
jgi:hypothetical protein